MGPFAPHIATPGILIAVGILCDHDIIAPENVAEETTYLATQSCPPEVSARHIDAVYAAVKECRVKVTEPLPLK